MDAKQRSFYKRIHMGNGTGIKNDVYDRIVHCSIEYIIDSFFKAYMPECTESAQF